MTASGPERVDWPVAAYITMGGQRPPLHYFHALDDFQQQARPFLRTEEAPGYWVFTDYGAILDGLRRPELFSSRVLAVPDDDPLSRRIPFMLDPPEHTTWRRLLRPYFSRGRIARSEDHHREIAQGIIEGLRPIGECDFYREFADVFAVACLLHLMGLPPDRGSDFLRWEHTILLGDPLIDPDGSAAVAAMTEAAQYFHGVIAQLREHPDSRGDDIIRHAVGWRIDGRPVSDSEIVSCLLALFIAGLETVTAQLSYIFLHLAMHDADRQRIIVDPQIAPYATEEFLRAYPIAQTARMAVQDGDFHGCPIRARDMVAFPLGMAGRDDQVFPGAKAVDLDRRMIRHISFGAGPHRCLGSHLARQELTVAIQEWHRLIPDYRVADPARVVEHASSVYSLEALPLAWDIAASADSG